MSKYAGGCEHVHTQSDNDPIDNHTCHCSVCKRVTGQDTTHVVFFNHDDLIKKLLFYKNNDKLRNYTAKLAWKKYHLKMNSK